MLNDLFRMEHHVFEELNDALADPSNPLVADFLRVVAKYGTPEEINAKADEARKIPNILEKLRAAGSPYVQDLEWLVRERDRGAFVSIGEFRSNVLGGATSCASFDASRAVTLEVSALQYFPWLITEAKKALDERELMPGRIIRVRKMREQEQDGDLLAVTAAAQILGASLVETLDTKGTDGSNVHLGGPDTITGYFGGIGQPNAHPLAGIDEVRYYYTTYGVREVLNINPGTVLLGYLLYRLGVNVKFKISVFMGNDNPYSVLWTLLMARLFARPDGSTSLIGFNLSNSIDARHLELAGDIRRTLGLEDKVRIEHHITECYRHIVRQPYCRRDDLLDVAEHIPNISAKHEGGDPEKEMEMERPSDILDYFRDKQEILASGEMPVLEKHYLGKHDAMNRTAAALTRKGLSFIAAPLLHRR